jgi:hypothetical protein
MSIALAQRAILLGAATLLAVVVALGIAEQRSGAVSSSDLPAAVPAPDGGWYEARAGLESRRAYGRPTACGGLVLERETLGVSHPVLVCGAKIYIGYGRTVILTQVVARGPGSAGVQFGLTESLARELGVRGRTRIRWRFASPERLE